MVCSIADLQKPPVELDGKACAAVGQNSLIALYDQLFSQVIFSSSSLLGYSLFSQWIIYPDMTTSYHSCCAAGHDICSGYGDGQRFPLPRTKETTERDGAISGRDAGHSHI